MWTYEQVEHALTVAGEAWLASASEQPLQMHAQWDAHPFAPSTLPCGRAFDVIALPDQFGRQVLNELRDTGPVTTYGGAIHVFCVPGTAEQLRQLLAWREWDHLPPVHCYGTGDTVTLPPTQRHQDDDTPDRWLRAPEDSHPQLPRANALLHACLRAARTQPQPPKRTPMTTDTLTSDPLTTLRTLATAHLANLDQQRQAAADAAREREIQRLRNQADRSQKNAIDRVRERLTATLHQVLAPEDWTGYPSMPDTDTHTATAHLGQGVWAIYHQATQPYAVYSGIYLLLPCPCGDYIETEVPSDELLAETLESITRWQADPATCTGACSPATWPTPWAPESTTPDW